MKTEKAEKGLDFCVDFFRPPYLNLKEAQMLRDTIAGSSNDEIRKNCELRNRKEQKKTVLICTKMRLIAPPKSALPTRFFSTVSYFYKGSDLKRQSSSYECKVMSGEADEVRVTAAWYAEK